MLVGTFCTLCSAALMFFFYNLLEFGYWPSSAVSYIAGCALSYTLNRRLTFHSDESVWHTLPKYAVNVALCYIAAFSLAKPAAALMLSHLNVAHQIVEQAAMIVGMLFFGVLNYFGQRLFTFRHIKRKRRYRFR